MTSAQFVEMSVNNINNIPSQDYTNQEDLTTRSTLNPGFTPFTVLFEAGFHTLQSEGDADQCSHR